MDQLADLFKKVSDYNPGFDREKLTRAYEYASLVHAQQLRLNKLPFIEHCLGVAIILTEVKADDDTLCAALLHDTLEYSNLKAKDLVADFGGVVAWLVEMVSEVNPLERSATNPSENLRKMFLAMARDIRVVLIRLAEKLDNLKVVQFFPSDEAKVFCQRILEIYAPLAERLGIFVLKRQLEDQAFAYLYPQEYQQIVENLSIEQAHQEEYLSELKQLLDKGIKGSGVSRYQIFGRAKNTYSIFKKLQKYRVEGKIAASDKIEKIYDQLALTILVEDVTQCYTVLGIIHWLFKNLPEEFDDYISSPKANGYQAIQTTVFGPSEKAIEIQIKTFEMHEYNEFGPASHVYYKMFGSRQKASEDKIGWIKELALWQQTVSSTEEFSQGLSLDFFADQIYVFTPKGDVKDLPVGATPVDFAYTIHSDIGNRLTGAKINGKVVSLDTKLKNGEVVELKLARDLNKKPNRDWLNFVVTTRAKKEIKKFYLG